MATAAEFAAAGSRRYVVDLGELDAAGALLARTIWGIDSALRGGSRMQSD
jgi:hypothetical protein